MGEFRIGSCTVECFQKDITQVECDAIVNAANTSLLGGGGVDGAIHRRGGPAVLEACKRLGGCETGDAKITPAGELPAAYVIHTPGPVWQGGMKGESTLLSSCYRRSLEIAKAYDCHCVAFPSISTGVYNYPIEDAARIAINTVLEFLREHDTPLKVSFVLFSQTDLTVYESLFAETTLAEEE